MCTPENVDNKLSINFQSSNKISQAMCSHSNDVNEWTDMARIEDEGSESSHLTSESCDAVVGPCKVETSTSQTESNPLSVSLDESTAFIIPADDNSKTVVHCSSGSSSSFCRICQVGDEASEERLETCRCHCKGHLARVHRSCLVEWVRYRGSNLCEICGGTFQDVPNPVGRLGINQIDPTTPSSSPSPSPPEFLYYQALEALQHQLALYQPISRRKRSAMAGVIIFLLVVTGVTGILTISADRDFQRTNADPWASEAELRKTHIVFSICISFLFFSVTLTLGLVLMWLVLECYFYVQRRRILHDAAIRIVQAGRSQRNAIT